MTMVGTSITRTSAVMFSKLVCLGQAIFAGDAPAGYPQSQFAILRAEWFGSQHVVDGRLHRLAVGIGARHHLPRFEAEKERREPGQPARRADATP
jgi:hypothetical protein